MQDGMQNEKRAWFGKLAAVQPAEMIGLWRGAGIASGHPIDGVLENLQWFGKRFHPDLRADALLFQWQTGRLVPIDPGFIPLRLSLRLGAFGRTGMARNWFSHLQRSFRAKGTTASLESRGLDGVLSAAMVYDRQPIVDHFRRIDAFSVAGMMIVEGDARHYFFRLEQVVAAEDGR